MAGTSIVAGNIMKVTGREFLDDREAHVVDCLRNCLLRKVFFTDNVTEELTGGAET